MYYVRSKNIRVTEESNTMIKINISDDNWIVFCIETVIWKYIDRRI